MAANMKLPASAAAALPHSTPAADARAAELARSLDCFTQEDVSLLTNTTPSTVETWRKRGVGPAYSLIGNRAVYPRAALVEFIAQNIRERKTAPGASVL